MIRRGPRPDNGFLTIRNGVARDPRLSYRASGVLADLLSRPDNWRTSAERLAQARPKGEGRDAVRKALNELERAGYLRRTKACDTRGRWSTELVVHETPEGASDTDDGFSVVGKPGTGNQSSENQASQEDHQENLEEEDQSSARSARRQEDSHNGNTTAAEIEGWRTEDRAAFRAVVGESLVSSGHGTWKEGHWTTDAFYRAFRGKKDPIKWPGRFVESLADIDDWLLDQGLERVK